MADVYTFTPLSLKQYHPKLRAFLKGLHLAGRDFWRNDYSRDDFLELFNSNGIIEANEVERIIPSVIPKDKFAKEILNYFVKFFRDGVELDYFNTLFGTQTYNEFVYKISKIKDKTLRQILFDLISTYRRDGAFDFVKVNETYSETPENDDYYNISYSVELVFPNIYDKDIKVYKYYKALSNTFCVILDTNWSGEGLVLDVYRSINRLKVNLYMPHFEKSSRGYWLYFIINLNNVIILSSYSPE